MGDLFEDDEEERTDKALRSCKDVLSCPECKGPLRLTGSYWSCPEMHGKLIQEPDLLKRIKGRLKNRRGGAVVAPEAVLRAHNQSVGSPAAILADEV